MKTEFKVYRNSYMYMYSAAQISPKQNLRVICISRSLFHSHKNNVFCLTSNASHKETYGNA